MVTDKGGFYTMKGYERSASDEMTSSMEDYLEMVCRMEEEGEPIRVSSPGCQPSRTALIRLKNVG